MKKLMLLILTGCFLGACQSPTPEYTAEDLARIDEIKDSLSNKITNEANDKVFGDTIGISKAPIKITSYKIIKSDGGKYRNVRVTYRNVSTKTVTAIKIAWKGVDAFGDPADLGNSYAIGYGGGFTEDVIKPGGNDAAMFEILSRDAKTITLAWPAEVAFSDGSKWKQN